MKKIVAAPSAQTNIFNLSLDDNEYFQNNTMNQILWDKIHGEGVDFGVFVVCRDIQMEVNPFINVFEGDEFIHDAEILVKEDGSQWYARCKTKNFGNIVFRFDYDFCAIEMYVERISHELLVSPVVNSYESKTSYWNDVWSDVMQSLTYERFNIDTGKKLSSIITGV